MYKIFHICVYVCVCTYISQFHIWEHFLFQIFKLEWKTDKIYADIPKSKILQNLNHFYSQAFHINVIMDSLVTQDTVSHLSYSLRFLNIPRLGQWEPSISQEPAA